MTRYDGPGWTLDETRFSYCHKTWQSSEVAVSGNESPLFKFNLPGPKSFWLTEIRVYRIHNTLCGKSFTISAAETVMSEKPKTGTQMFSGRFWPRSFSAFELTHTATCDTSNERGILSVKGAFDSCNAWACAKASYGPVLVSFRKKVCTQ